MGHGPVHPAPKPARWGFVGYLAILAAVTFILFALIRKPTGDSFLFIVGFICFLAPLVGWAVTVSLGRWLPRMGDFLPVGALLVSFCCGFTIFKEVILDDYQPGYAREYRFNWFSIAGDGAKGVSGARQLSDDEYAASRGIPMAEQRARQHFADSPSAAEALDHTLTTDAAVRADMLEGLAGLAGTNGAPALKNFDPRAKDAAKVFVDLPQSVRLDLYFALTAARLRAALTAPEKDAGLLVPQYQVAVIHDAFHGLVDEYALYRKQVLAEAAAAGKPVSKDAADAMFVPALPQLKTLHDKHIHPIWHDHENDPAKAAKGEAQKLTTAAEFRGFLTAFADSEQVWHNWCYANVPDAKSGEQRSPLYTDVLMNLRQADDPLFQAFAVGIFIDNTTAVTIFMVTLLAFLIHLFSLGYMHGEIRYTRFMATINLFTAGMIGLVLANNFLWLFICWEIMGLCSYLLIGHYFEKKSAQEASMKAFFTTRIADTFMFMGMMMIFAATGTFLFAGSDAANEAMRATGSFMGSVEYGGVGSFFNIIGSKELFIGGCGATAIGLLCFIGPAGKSAQFPFHVWLPDAMEGPTPVSAMIHAACMVSAGVYLTARLFPLFTPDTLQIIAIIGGFTALGAGTIGLVQTDIKKVLAYSTISQLGYMFMGIGVGAWYPAVFHMLTHAFFKALMFLGSGSVILGCHHEQEMTKMGGLWKKMPITAATFWIGNASIIGLPFFFAGYYSKEAILTDAVIFGHSSGQMLPYIFGALGAGLTTFYMCRLMWLTFHGKPRDKHIVEGKRDFPWTAVAAFVFVAAAAVAVAMPNVYTGAIAAITLVLLIMAIRSWYKNGHDGHSIMESPWTVVTPLVVIAIGALAITWPIGAHDDGVNLGLTNFNADRNGGAEVQDVRIPAASGKLDDDAAAALLAAARGFNPHDAISRLQRLDQPPRPDELELVAAAWLGAHHGGLAHEIETELAGAGITFAHIDARRHKGVQWEMAARTAYPPQAANESWMAARVRKPAVAYSEGFLRTEYADYVGEKRSLGHGVERDRLDALYADGHGRPQYAGIPAWKKYDLTAVDPDKVYGSAHGSGHGDAGSAQHAAHAMLPTAEPTTAVASATSTAALISASGAASAETPPAHGEQPKPADPHAPSAAKPTEPHGAAPASGGDVAQPKDDSHAGVTGHGEDAHDDHGGHSEAHGHGVPNLDSHAVHEYHDAHHGAHQIAFMVALIMLGLGIAGSVYFYLGPLAGRDWVGHHGFRASVKRLLKNAYFMDAFYFATVLRLNRWLRQFFSWVDRVFVDGFVNLFGTVTRFMAKAAATVDHWGVDGSVRGMGNATIWGGRQSARAVTGRIQDYVFLLVAGVVILFMLLILLK